MRKAFITCIFIFVLSGCGARTMVNNKNDSIDEVPHEIAITIGGVPEYEHNYFTMESLAEGSEEIIYGEVIDYHCEVMEHFIYTFEDVRVEQSFKGDLQPGDRIKIRKMYGEVSVSEYIEGLKEYGYNEEAQSYEQQYTEEERDKLYIQYSTGDEIKSEIGQTSIFFIINCPYFGTNQVYDRLNEGQGQYLEISAGKFENVVAAAEDASNVLKASSDEPLEQNPVYTMDEMKEQIN